MTGSGAEAAEPPASVPAGGVLLIDWGCGFCQRTRAWIERHASDGFTFAALGSEEGDAWLAACGREPDDRGTVVLVEHRKGRMVCTDRSTAVLRVLRQMDLPYRLLYLGIVVPRPLRDAVYKWVSRHRHRL